MEKTNILATDDVCCGACKCFCFEDVNGIGCCFLDNSIRYCGEACTSFIKE